jgi:hypothetical protein
VSDNALAIGSAAGLVFGAWNLAWTWLRPLEDDTPAALLRFYGPLFLIWTVVAFLAARRAGRLSSGALAGTRVAFATVCVFVVLNFVRVNLFLNELTGRTDWQNLMGRFNASGFNSLRLFVNLDYLKGTLFVVGFLTLLGAVLGTAAGTIGRLTARDGIETA